MRWSERSCHYLLDKSTVISLFDDGHDIKTITEMVCSDMGLFKNSPKNKTEYAREYVERIIYEDYMENLRGKTI